MFVDGAGVAGEAGGVTGNLLVTTTPAVTGELLEDAEDVDAPLRWSCD